MVEHLVKSYEDALRRISVVWKTRPYVGRGEWW